MLVIDIIFAGWLWFSLSIVLSIQQEESKTIFSEETFLLSTNSFSCKEKPDGKYYKTHPRKKLALNKKHALQGIIPFLRMTVSLITNAKPKDHHRNH